VGPRFGPPIWDPYLGGDMGPRFGTLIWGVIWYPDLVASRLLMPNVISKIKQNSSDMNEIILAPCDAGYVQSCTGLNRRATILCTNRNRPFMNKSCHLATYSFKKFDNCIKKQGPSTKRIVTLALFAGRKININVLTEMHPAAKAKK
jgi:hypothetical protein